MLLPVLLSTTCGHLSVRPYSEHSDQYRLEQICADVYGGSDYLPRIAPELAADSACTFLVGHDESKLVAVANVRVLSNQVAWLEAVRTDGSVKNRGYGSAISRAALQVAAESGRGTLSATVFSNSAMRRIFSKLGMSCTAKIRLLSWDALRELPGWSAALTNSPSPPEPPEPLLSALGLEGLITPEERALAGRFEPLRTAEELIDVLSSIGGPLAADGLLPALYKVQSPTGLEDERGFAEGRVLALRREQPAVLALFRDGHLSSVRTRWVAAVCASSSAGLAAALWRAHLIEPAFVPAIDGGAPVFRDPGRSSRLVERLPLSDDHCLIYRTGAWQVPLTEAAPSPA